MKKQEKERRIRELLAELRELRATPRSDWHAVFEALLRIETHRFRDVVHILTEEEIGVEPPRMDYVILVEDKQVQFDKDIFKFFRRINILEYKNPRDSLNERSIYKMCGYANLYIGTAEHEGDRPADQVTMSIFRATKPIRLFKRLEKNGMLARGDVPGIYRVTGITNLPFQIVVTNELEGDQYAAYRAMTENAKKNDVERVIEDSGAELDEVIREHYHTLLKLVVEKNPKYIDVVKGVEDMEDILLEMVKDRVDEKVNEKVNEKEQETKISDIKGVMESFGVSVDRAMDALKIPASQRSKYAGLIRKGM